MSELIKVPDLGGEGEVIEILVKEGDQVEAEQSLAVLESDKASMEIPSPKAGKVKAIKDAVIEGGLETDAVARVSALRGPVFKLASMAIGLTMLTAILGGGVDTGVIPSGVHALLAIMAVVANFLALRAIVEALSASGKIVDEVNRDLGV